MTEKMNAAEESRRILERLTAEDLPYERGVVMATMAQTWATLGQLEAAMALADLQRQLLATMDAGTGSAIPADVRALAEAILADPHRDDHILELREDGWTLKHPIAERIGDDLFRCPLAAEGDLLREEWENDAHEDLGLYKVELDGPEGDRWLRMELVRPA